MNLLSQEFGPQQVITTNIDDGTFVFASDLDGDGDMDILSASNDDNKIAWYENDGSGNFVMQQVITTNAILGTSVYASDLDGDGDMDVLSASRSDNKIAWYENDGSGGFSAQKIISVISDGARSVYASDLDNDGDMDVLSASSDDDKIAWYENDGNGNFSTQQVITINADFAACVYASDLDGDGNIDVLSASLRDNKIAWYKNDGGGSFGVQQVITTNTNGAVSVYACDLNGDGDEDVLSASISDDKIAWYKNDGSGNFGVQQVITTNTDGARSVYASDLDNDGDLDVLSGSLFDDKIAWYENDGNGNFNVQQIIATTADRVISIYTSDLDGDGDMDVLSASWDDNKIAWYENLMGFKINVTINNHSCIGTSNGSLLVELSGLHERPYHYIWSRDGGVTTGSGTSEKDVFTINNLAAGIYEIEVVDANSDIVKQDGIMLNTTPGSSFEIVDLTTTNTSKGLSNGAIEVVVDGGRPNYTYSWSGPSSGNQTLPTPIFTIPNLSAGDYQIIVQESGGAISSYTITLLDEDVSGSTCNGPLDIVILNDVSGSVDAIEYVESKQFFVDFINALNIGNSVDDARAAIVEWSSTGEQNIVTPLTGNRAILQNYSNANRVYNGGTNPLDALEFGKTYLESNGRPNVPKVLVLSTDAASFQVSGSLIALADQYKALGYHIVTIAFDDAFTNGFTNNILRQTASVEGLVYGADTYFNLTNDLAEKIINLYICPVDPGSTATVFLRRDGRLQIDGYTVNGSCPNPDNVEINLTVEALQQLSLPPGTPITFYYNNPAMFSATPILTYNIPCAVSAGSSENITVTLPVNNPANIYAVLNDDGSQSPPLQLPVTGIKELTFVNNIDNIAVCTDPIATVVATKYVLNNKPTCSNTVIYTVDVCNISSIDATGIQITDDPPTGFVLESTNVNLNNCSSDNGTYNIPAGCCLSITYTYDANGASNGLYKNQGVTLSGPGGQTYINFDGSATTAEDVEIDGTSDCISTTVTFNKTVNTTDICEESFVTYQFTIDNQTNIDLTGLSFQDNLPSPVIWAAEPYLLNGLSIGNTNITGSNNADFTIAKVKANTAATFYMDAYLGDWTTSGTLSNTANLNGFPAFVNGNGNALSASSAAVNVHANPEIQTNTLVKIKSNERAQLNANASGANVTWTSSGDGVFSAPNNENTFYTPGYNDLNNRDTVFLNISAKSPIAVCGEDNETVKLVIEPVYDYGDAPNSYKTLKINNGANHYLTHESSSSLFLGGNAPDEEIDGNPTAIGQPALGDDNSFTDDEDGVLEIDTLKMSSGGKVFSFSINTTNLSNSSANVYGWIDFNGNGEFEVKEGAVSAVNGLSGNSNIAINFNVPTDIKQGVTYARFRITTQNLTDNAGTTNVDERSIGDAFGGEVEDYVVVIVQDEICDNGIDDDLDGFIDTLDTDCQTCTALFSAQDICLGDTLNLSASKSFASPSANIIKYNWSFDNGDIDNQPAIDYVYQTSGTYTIELIIEDDSMCIDTTSQIITVHNLPSASISTISDLCINDTIKILTEGSPTGGNYYGNAVLNNTINPSLAGIGLHSLEYVYIDANGCADTASANINVNQTPTVSLQPFTDICLNGSVLTLNGGTPISGAYQINGVPQSSFNPLNYGVGQHNIDYIYTDGSRCSDTASQIIQVIDFEWDSIHAPICNGDSYILPDGEIVTVPGVHLDTFNIGLCGKIIHTNVFADGSIENRYNFICDGSFFVLPGGDKAHITGTYIDTFISVSNCDSIIISHIGLKTYDDCLEDCFVTIPSAFTPNGDNLNDVFRALTSCEEEFKEFELQVFNRLGELVFTSNDFNIGWDGRFKDEEAELDSYIYFVRFIREGVVKEETLRGMVVLMR